MGARQDSTGSGGPSTGPSGQRGGWVGRHDLSRTLGADIGRHRQGTADDFNRWDPRRRRERRRRLGRRKRGRIPEPDLGPLPAFGEALVAWLNRPGRTSRQSRPTRPAGQAACTESRAQRSGGCAQRFAGFAGRDVTPERQLSSRRTLSATSGFGSPPPLATSVPGQRAFTTETACANSGDDAATT